MDGRTASRSTRARGLVPIATDLVQKENSRPNQINANHGSPHKHVAVEVVKPKASPAAVAPPVVVPSAPSEQAPATPSAEPYETIEERHNDVVIRRYLKGKLLGKGGFAKAYLATCLQTQKQYAIKVVLKSTLTKPKAKAKLQAEVKIHSSLKHHYVVRFHHFFEDQDCYYMILELCPNRSFSELMKKRKRLTEPEVQYYMLQLLEGLSYMHSVGVIHRDLKLGNLLLDKNMCVKIGDLGLAAKVVEPGERKKTLCGTPNYIAPEILENKDGHSFQVDIWSTGVVLYTMLVGRPPYESKDVKATYKRILANDYTFPDHSPISEAAKDLIRWMLQTDPNMRPSIPAIAAHPFFTRSQLPRGIPVSALNVAPTYEQLMMDPKLHPREDGAGHAAASANGLAAQPEMRAERPLEAKAAEPVKEAERPERASHGAGTLHAGAGVTPVGTAPVGTAPDRVMERILGDRKPPALIPQPATAHTQPAVRTDKPALSEPARAMADPSRDLWRSKASPAAPGKEASAREASAKETSRPLKETDPSAKRVAAAAVARAQRPDPGRLAETGPTLVGEKTAPHLGATFRPGAGSSADAGPRDDRDERARRSRGPSEGGAPAHTEPPLGLAHRTASAFEPPAASSAFRSTKDLGATTTLLGSAPGSTKGGGALSPHGGDLGMLESIHHQLALTLDHGGGGERAPEWAVGERRRSGAGPQQWVTQYVDYTSKYGLGYLLSDGSTGVYFNDSTKITLSGSSDSFQYMERSKGDDDKGGVENHTLAAYPPTLHKKVTLLQHFRDYLLQQQKEKGKGATPIDEPPAPRTVWGEAAEPLVFVKKWVRTRHAILFRLSNHAVQVMFLDNTEVVLSSEARVVTFCDKQGQRRTMALQEVIDSPRSDITKRLKYTKDILRQLISTGKR